MRRYIAKSKGMKDLSFEDLYIEIEEEPRPNIRNAIVQLASRLKRRKDMRIHNKNPLANGVDPSGIKPGPGSA